jgi:hypothetical protein
MVHVGLVIATIAVILLSWLIVYDRLSHHIHLIEKLWRMRYFTEHEKLLELESKVNQLETKISTEECHQ